MLGKPKYKYGDKVKFNLEDTIYDGEIYIVDNYGSFFDNSDVNYDILGEKNGEKILFKHINEQSII